MKSKEIISLNSSIEFSNKMSLDEILEVLEKEQTSQVRGGNNISCPFYGTVCQDKCSLNNQCGCDNEMECADIECSINWDDCIVMT